MIARSMAVAVIASISIQVFEVHRENILALLRIMCAIAKGLKHVLLVILKRYVI